jgi:hypothetical protein
MKRLWCVTNGYVTVIRLDHSQDVGQAIPFGWAIGKANQYTGAKNLMPTR